MRFIVETSRRSKTASVVKADYYAADRAYRSSGKSIVANDFLMKARRSNPGTHVLGREGSGKRVWQILGTGRAQARDLDSAGTERRRGRPDLARQALVSAKAMRRKRPLRLP